MDRADLRALISRRPIQPPLRVRQDVNRLLLAVRSRTSKIPSDPVFVLATARTGSTVLVNYMNCLPGVQIDGELIHDGGSVGIHEHATSEQVLGHLRRALGVGDASTRGAKLLLRGLAARRLSPDDLRGEFPEVRFVILWRQALGEQYVSGEVAKATGVWHTRGPGSKASQAQIHVDRDHLISWIDRLEGLYVKTLAPDWVRERSLFVSYEQMIEDPQLLLNDSVAPFLKLPSATARTNYTKVIDRPLSNIVSNYEEVSDLLERRFHLDEAAQ